MTANTRIKIVVDLLKHELRSRFVAVLGWGIGLALYCVLYIGIYPQVSEQMGEAMATLDDLPIYQAVGMEMASFEGFMASVLVQFIPILLAIYAIMTSTATLAGEDDRGTLELLVTMPLERWQIVTVKASALAIACFMILAIAGVGGVVAVIGVRNFIATDVTGTQVYIAILSAWPITFALLMIGLFWSACSPNRLTASMATTIIFLGSYFGETLAGMVRALEAIKPFSLFTYFDSSAALFSKGVQAGDVGVLLGVAAFFFVLALLSFQRRDITVGQWPWQRAKARHALK